MPLPVIRRPLFLIVVILAGLAFAVWHPLLAPWVNDEPRLLGNALYYNANDTWAPFGLRGSFRVQYGPLPTWLYQLVLRATHDLGTILLTHAAFFYVTTIGAMLWLGRELRLRLGFVAAVAVTPAVCFYSRLMWDNSFLIPLSLALLALYARFVRKQTIWLPALVAAAAVVACTIHLMVLPLIAALALHAILRRLFTPSRVIAALIGAALASVPFWTYFHSQWQTISISAASATLPTTPPDPVTPVAPDFNRLSTPGAVMFAFTGSQVLAGDASNLPRFTEGVLGGVQTAAAAVSWLVHGLFAVGVVTAVRQWLRKSSWQTPQSPADELRLVSLLTVLLLIMMFAATHSLAGPHYFNGTLAAYILLAWTGLESLGSLSPLPVPRERARVRADSENAQGTILAPSLTLPRSTGRGDQTGEGADRTDTFLRTTFLAVLTTALAVSTFLCLLNLHQTQGRQTDFGPTVAAQRDALHELAGFHSRNCVTDVIQWQAFPFGPVALAALDGRDFGAKPHAANPPVVSAESEGSGRMRVSNALSTDFVPLESHTGRAMKPLDLGVPLMLQQ